MLMGAKSLLFALKRVPARERNPNPTLLIDDAVALRTLP